MAKFFQNLLTALKYLLIQGLFEILLIVLFEYAGIKVLTDFSKANLLIENIQGISWEISMKTIMFSLVYIPLFMAASALLIKSEVNRSFLYGIINGTLSILLSIVFLLLLRKADFSDVSNLLFATLLSSVLILVIVKIRNNPKRQA